MPLPSATAAPFPKLAPPGAGLPWPELQIARLIFHVSRRRSTRATAAALLDGEQASVLGLLRNVDTRTAATPVLISRLPGMEDSSRNWSVFMTLDHVRLANLAIADTLKELARGNVPSRAASTAAIKPDPRADASVVAAFSRSCELVAQRAAAIPDLHTPQRFAHPWFGPLDAAGWHYIAGFHLRLHRGQIERILRGLLPRIASA